MKKLWIRWVALLLVFAMVLAGCGKDETLEENDNKKTQSTQKNEDPTEESEPTDESNPEGEGETEDEPKEDVDPWDAPKFEDMEYTRPDVDALKDALAVCNELIEGKDSQALYDALEEYFTLYNSYGTNYYLAHIHYNLDLKDEQWEEEYNYCSEYAADSTSDTDRLLHDLAASSHRDFLESKEEFGEGFFDAYDGTSLWTDRFTELIAEEERLQTEYYSLVGENAEYQQLAMLLVDMVLLRQEIAKEAGYEDFSSFAYEFYFDRDYTVDQAAQYLEEIRETLVPLTEYMYINTDWYDCLKRTTTKETYAYVQDLAEAMGGVVEEAFRLMDEKELYHIKSKLNKMESSFEVFLPDYMVPFVFVSPAKISHDHLTFAHEFGHFCNDFASEGWENSVDVAEIFSQAMENLSLLYVDDSMEHYRMLLTLLTYVEQGAFADFELQLYNLDAEDVTVENIEAIFADVIADYALEYESDLYTMVNHFFTSPMYVMSYVVSNDVALQIYQMELEEEGAGLECYIENLDNTTGGFLAFLESAGLGSPFDPGRIEEVYNTLENALS